MTNPTRRGDPYAVDRIREAAALLRHRASRSTPGPWRLGNSPYAALVADQPHPSRAHAEKGGWAWDDGYGGCLVGESMMAADRVYLVTMQPEVGALLADHVRHIPVNAAQRKNMPHRFQESHGTQMHRLVGQANACSFHVRTACSGNVD